MFNRILIPTNLSDGAAAAVRYGVQLFRRMPQARIRFFYASHRPLPPCTPVRLYRELKADMLREDLGLLEQHVRRVLREAHLAYEPQQMELHVENGFYLDTLKNVLRNFQPGLLVMGTRGTSGLKKYLTGSNAVKTLNVAQCPVLAVPRRHTPAPVPLVVYATDLEQWQQEVERVTALAAMFNARLTVLHLHQPKELPLKGHDSGEVLVDQLRAALPYRPSTVALQRVSGTQGLTERLQQMVAAAQPVLLVMFPRKKSWLEKVFTASRTQQMLYNAQVPVLAFNHEPAGPWPGSSKARRKN
jgi:nucleotide-binding universal stress UspA family protein